MIHGDNMVEAMEIGRLHLPRAQAANVDTAKAQRHLPRTGIGRVAGMPITGPRRIDHQLKAEPLRMVP
jgi:hypothetical protein